MQYRVGFEMDEDDNICVEAHSWDEARVIAENSHGGIALFAFDEHGACHDYYRNLTAFTPASLANQ